MKKIQLLFNVGILLVLATPTAHAAMHLKNSLSTNLIFMFIWPTVKVTVTAGYNSNFHTSPKEGQKLVTLQTGFSAEGYPDQSNINKNNISWTFDNTLITYAKPGGTSCVIDERLFAMTKNKDLIIKNMTLPLYGEYKQMAGNETIVIYVVEIPVRIIIVKQTYNEKTIGKIQRGDWCITYGFDKLPRRGNVCDIKVYALTVSLCSKPPNDTSNSCENRPEPVGKIPVFCELKIQYNYTAKRNEKLYLKFIHNDNKIQLFPLTMENKGEVTPSYPTQGITMPQMTNSTTTPASMKRTSRSEMTASVPSTSSPKNTPTNSMMTPTPMKRSTSDMTASVPPIISAKDTPTSTSGLSTLGIIVISICAIVFVLLLIVCLIWTCRLKQSYRLQSDDNGENQNGAVIIGLRYTANSPTRLNSLHRIATQDHFG